MDKQLTFLATWFATAFITFIFSAFSLIYLFDEKVVPVKTSDFRLYAALPQTNSLNSDEIITEDARAKIVENFFNEYKSVLAEQSNIFVSVADKYELDYRLLPAISMQESNGAKRMFKGSYNPFGFGIYGSLALRFSSFEEAIEKVAQSLREDYLNIGLTTTEEIMSKYTPPSLEKGGVWAKGVNSFMEKMN